MKLVLHDKLNVCHIIEFFFDREENVVGKRESAG